MGENVEVITTGIEGFDDMAGGGLPKGSNVLVTGGPGTGKSIFGLEYLYRGAQMNENGVYITMESSVEQIKLRGKQFGWDLEGMEKLGKIFFLRVPIEKIKFDLFDAIDKIVTEIKAKRIVFDGLMMFAINMDLFSIPVGYGGSIASSISMDATEAKKMSSFGNRGAASIMGTSRDKISYTGSSEKRMIFLIIEKLASLGTTNLVITYGARGRTRLTLDGMSEFICDGIVEMYNDLLGTKYVRTMAILKMRNAIHSPYVHSFDIEKEGIVVKPAE